MRLEDHDFEGLFQLALAQFDDRPGVKRAMIALYRSFAKLLIELVRADARKGGHRK